MMLPLVSHGSKNEKMDKVMNPAEVNVYNIIATMDVDLSEVAYPYIIDIPVPKGNIVEINGPTRPKVQTWEITNGRLVIKLYEEDMDDVRIGGTHYIEVSTSPQQYYAIQLNAY